MESNDKLEQLLRQMYAKEALHDEDIDTSDIIDEAWTKFEAEHFRGERSSFARLLPKGRKKSEVRGKRLPLRKIAAMIISVLMLSGIAYATVHIISSHSQKAQEEQTITAAAQTATPATQQIAQDSTLTEPVVYEDAELVNILNEIATFYQVEPVFKNEDIKHVRLYFTWDREKTIDDIIDTFNKFERIHISRENKKLIVE